MKKTLESMKYKMLCAWYQTTASLREAAMKKEAGIDGILVSVGLCIIALLLCVVMKDSLKEYIETLVTSMTTRAQGILTGP